MDYKDLCKYTDLFDNEKDSKQLAIDILKGKIEFNFDEFIKAYNEGDEKFLYTFFNEDGKDITKKAENEENTFYDPFKYAYQNMYQSEAIVLKDIKYFLDVTRDLQLFYDKENKECVIAGKIKGFMNRIKFIINDSTEIKKFIDIMAEDLEKFREILDEKSDEYNDLSNMLDND